MSDKKYWLGLSLIQQIGGVRLRTLVDHFGTAQKAWQASKAALRQAGLPGSIITQFEKAQATLDLDAELHKVGQAGAHIITQMDDDYPLALRNVGDAPPLLYVRGTLLPQDELALAIVGTRRATRYGQDASNRIATYLAKQDVTIVSGLAQGIDTAAHLGALDAGGRTIAVLGCGIDLIYPRENETLAQRIVQHGAIISELPMGTPPNGKNFPRRNRLISGLSLGVLIGEAPIQSGALITAEAALEQGREVFAIPANIFNPMGTGSNQLIQEGAKLIMRAQDILDELNIAHIQQATQVQTKTLVPENDLEAAVLRIIETDPIHIDDIIRLTGLATDEVTATLTILELKGLAQMVGQMQYCRSR